MLSARRGRNKIDQHRQITNTADILNVPCALRASESVINQRSCVHRIAQDSGKDPLMRRIIKDSSLRISTDYDSLLVDQHRTKDGFFGIKILRRQLRIWERGNLGLIRNFYFLVTISDLCENFRMQPDAYFKNT